MSQKDIRVLGTIIIVACIASVATAVSLMQWYSNIAGNYFMSSSAATAAGNGAVYVSQSVPASLVAGQTATVMVTMKNNGVTTWTASKNYFLGSQNPQDNLTWGGRVGLLSTDQIGPGGEKTFTFTIKAPGTPGTYNFQWRMLREGYEWFGQYTQNVQIVVTAPLGEMIDTLDFLISDHLDQVLGGSHNMSHFMSGNNYYNVNWSPDSFSVHTWDSNYIYLKEDHSGAPAPIYTLSPGIWMKRFMRVGETINVSDNTLQWYDNSCNPTSQKSFPYSVTLESHIPNYNIGGDLGTEDVIVLKYEYRGGMERSYLSREWGFILWEEYDSLGKPTSNRSVFNRVAGSPQYLPARACMLPLRDSVYVSQNVPLTLNRGESRTVSVKMRNTGGEIWTRNREYRLGSENPYNNLTWGIGRVGLTPTDQIGPGGEKTFTFTIKAPGTPGTYNFQWKILKENVAWFGASTPNVPIQVQ